jgi:hypothetical protein
VIENSLFFAPFTGEIKTSLVSNTDGTKTKEIVSMSNQIVERLSGFVADGTDNMLIPIRLGLNGNLMYGNQNFEGTGEELRYKWRKAFINQAGKTVEKLNGKMDRLRKSKLEQSYKAASPELALYFKKALNAEFISAHYEGHSLNVTTGLDNSPDGIGAKAIHHPNMYYYDGAAADNVLTKIGAAGKNPTTAQITAALDTGYANLEEIDYDFISRAEELCEEKNIQKAVVYKGKKYWLATVDRVLWNKLKANTAFKNSIEEAFMGKEYDNPLFNHNTWIAGEFMFVSDKKVTRAWNNDTLDFAGTNGFMGDPTYASAKGNSCINIFGTGALGWGNVDPFSTAIQKYNFGLQSELLALSIYGIGRGEYVAEADENTYFAKGNATKSFLSSAVSVHNESSLSLIVAK